MTDAPYGGLDFRVEIRLPGRAVPLCDAAFAECDGLEMRLDVKRVRDGGDRRGERLIATGFSAGEVTLRRGMTASLDLWEWMTAVADDPALRAEVTVTMLAPDGNPRVTFLLARCLPVRLRAPRLHAIEELVAIEELQLACESLEVVRPGRRPKRKPAARAVIAAVGGRARLTVPFNPSGLRRQRDAAGDRLQMTVHLDAAADGDAGDLTRSFDALLAAGAVRFKWGSFVYEGRVLGVAEEFDLFGADGLPTRATVTLELGNVTGG